MTPERWQQIRTVFISALERDPAERDVFVEELCDGDEALVPHELEHVVTKTLRKDPLERYDAMPPLVHDLRKVLHGLGSVAPAESQAPLSRPAIVVEEETVYRRRRRTIGYGGLGALLVVILIVAFFIGRGPPQQSATPARKMVVVLPFDNLGPPEVDYFAAGITEEIIGRLVAVQGLGVLSRTRACGPSA